MSEENEPLIRSGREKEGRGGSEAVDEITSSTTLCSTSATST
jgi:hypothetical protein